jgi:3-hydroxyisobutyrate dehydrogenase-like beta-hydroxyacid dehydrogenase
MGRGVAHNLVGASNDVAVWNRTTSVATDFAASTDARVADTLVSAVTDAEVVLSFLTDDQVSRAVWDQAMPACAPGALVIECSTISPERAEEFVSQATARGLQGAVALMVGSKPQADAGLLTFLVGGAPSAASRVAQVLEPASPSVRNVGAPHAAAILKLAINTMLATQLAGMAELKRVTESLGVANALDLVTDIPVFSPLAVGLLGRMRAGDFTPNFTVDLIEKDLGYMADLAREHNVEATVIDSVRDVFTRASARGLGDKDFSVIGG